jgi:hypothetical protein
MNDRCTPLGRLGARRDDEVIVLSPLSTDACGGGYSIGWRQAEGS